MQERYNTVPAAYWKPLGPAYEGIDANFKSIEAQLANMGGSGAVTLATAAPGTIIRCPWNGTAWTYDGKALTARPTSRTDIYLDLVGAPVSTADPAWMIDGDTRSDVA